MSIKISLKKTIFSFICDKTHFSPILIMRKRLKFKDKHQKRKLGVLDEVAICYPIDLNHANLIPELGMWFDGVVIRPPALD